MSCFTSFFLSLSFSLSRLASSIALFSLSLNRSFPCFTCYYKWYPLCIFLNFLFSVFGHCKASRMAKMCLVLSLFSVIVCIAVIVNAVMNLWVPQNVENFVTSWKLVSFSRRNLIHGVSKYGCTCARIVIHSAWSNLCHVKINCLSVSLCSWPVFLDSALLHCCYLEVLALLIMFLLMNQSVSSA